MTSWPLRQIILSMSDITTALGELDVVLGANYTDTGTVRLFQAAVVQWVLENPNTAMAKDPVLRLKVDGVLGPNTKKAATFVNKYIVTAQPNSFGDAITDETLAALPKVTLLPKASAAESIEMRKRTARDAAEKAKAARTPTEVREAAAKAQVAAQESPPEVRQAVAQAAAKAQAAQTPAEVKAAAAMVQDVADQVVAAPGGGSILDVLTKQYGPLPLWAWGLGGATVIGIGWYIRPRS